MNFQSLRDVQYVVGAPIPAEVGVGLESNEAN